MTKAVPNYGGGFLEKPYFKEGDFDRICRDALQKHGLFPSEPAPVRIDRFIEKHFNVVPTYENLPTGLLGFTLFGSKGVEEIVVSKALDEQGTKVAERRLRTTLAHESGHGLLHAHLFALGVRPSSLFKDGLDRSEPKILCRRSDICDSEISRMRPPRYRWWEYQANKAMASLLLPKSLVHNALTPILIHRGILGLLVLPSARREAAIRLVAGTFDVNPVVARLRLETLFPSVAERQLTL